MQQPTTAGPEQARQARRVLYRCGTRTNFLCPCGAAARRLKKLGLEYRTERVRRRRRDRPEIVELTRQPYVPVLVDGDQVVNDSRRILEYLDWAYGADRETKTRSESGDAAGTEAPSTMVSDD